MNLVEKLTKQKYSAVITRVIQIGKPIKANDLTFESEKSRSAYPLPPPDAFHWPSGDVI